MSRCHCRSRGWPARFETRREGFANAILPSHPRVSVLSAVKRHRRHGRRWRSFHDELVDRAILREARIMATLRWLPCNPLLVHAMRAEDAIRDRKRKGSAGAI